MICVVIKGPSLEEVRRQLAQATACADVVELRIDYFTSVEISDLKRLKSSFPIPMIYTLRSQSQGGQYAQSEESRLDRIRELAALRPDYLDLESHVPAEFIQEIALQYPEIKLILSYHDFNQTPENLESIYQEMKKNFAHYYKIAVKANNSIDALRLLCWAKSTNRKVIAISMGYHGMISRILGPVIGCPICYACLDEATSTAPGQITVKALLEQYRYRSLNSHTSIYALIGDPVDPSISDETHNHLIKSCGLNAVYVKIQLKAEELPKFFELARKLPFSGLSVTMPLKEEILPFLDHADNQVNEIGAANTLLLEGGKISGFNTDGVGALNAIEKRTLVKGKRIVIIGAGGAAKAIAYEARRRGGVVTIINRDATKAHELAQKFHCSGKGLEDSNSCAKDGYDILINSTPMGMPIDSQDILPNALVMDIKTKPKETPFLQQAQQKGCAILYGYRMFVEQAVGQFDVWLKDKAHAQERGKILDQNAIDCLKEAN